MRKTKKILSFILVAAMALTMFVPMATAAKFDDVPSTYQYYNAVENLAARGIINGIGDGKFAPDANVKREEFAKIVCIALVGSGEVAPQGGSGFTDVADDRWSSGYIKVAAAAGIINGMGDGTFAPDSPVTYEQAVKMIVCALGYNKKAEKAGGYPNGYLNVGGTLGLLKGVASNDAVKGQAASRGLIAKLVDSSLSIEILDPFTGKPSGSIEDNDSVHTVKGQIVAVPDATLYYGENPYFAGDDPNPCKKNEIQIDDKIYSISELGESDINSWLGKTVVAYYEEESGDDTLYLTSLSLQKNANIETEINLADVDGYSNTYIEYWSKADDDYIKADVDSDAIIMLNGSPVDPENPAYTLSALLRANADASGSITLLDAEGTGSASVIFLKVYETFLVNSISTTEYKIYNGITGATQHIVLDETDKSKNITFIKDGKRASFSSISKNNVLSVAAGDKAIEVIIRSDSTKSGKVNEITDNGSTIKIGSETFTVAKSFQEAAASIFEADATVTVYIDAFNRIVYAKAAETTYTYAYLVGAEKKGSTDETVYVRLYDIKSGAKLSPKQMELADKVKINGESYTQNANGILSKLATSASELNVGNAATGAGTYTQIIKYIASGSVIKQMIVYDDAKNISSNRGDNSVLMVDNLDAGALSVPGNGRIGSYTVSGAISLQIPSDRATGDYTGKGSNVYTPGNSYKVQVIDASSTGIPKTILVYGAATLGASDIDGAVPGIVTKISRSSAKVDGETTVLSYIVVKGFDGTEKMYCESENTELTVLEEDSTTSWSIDAFPSGDGYFDGLSVGDIVKVTAESTDTVLLGDDKASPIEELMIVVDADKVVSRDQAAAIAGVGTSNNTSNAQYRYFLGSVRALDVSLNQIQITNTYYTGAEGEEVLPDADGTTIINETYDDNLGKVSSAKVFIVDTQKSNDKMLSDAQLGDIIGANTPNIEAVNVSKVFMYQTNGTIKMIVIFK